MLIFEKIKWCNFLSTGNYFTEIDFLRNDKTLIFGPIGHGKSTLLDALYFVLFNTPYRKISKGLLVNSITKKNCLVEIEFSKNNKKYFVRRGIKPNIFEIFLDGTLLNQDASSRDYQKVLENIIGMNQKTFGQVVCLGSANYVPFMKLSTGERRTMVEDLLDIQVFSLMNQILKEELSSLKKTLSDFDHKVELLNEKKEVLENTVKNLENCNEAELLEKQRQIEEINTEIQNEEIEIEKLNKQIEEISKNIKDETKLLKNKNKITEFQGQIKSKIERYSEELNFFSNNDVCPTCDQGIAEDIKKEKKSLNTDKLNKQKENYEKLLEEKKKINESLEEIEKYNNQISNINKQILQRNSEIQSKKKNISFLNNQISEINQSSALISDYHDQISVLEEKKNLLQEEKIALLSKKNIIDISAVLLKDNGIKAQVIKQYVPIINNLINQYLSTMDFLIQFHIDEEFNESIKSRYRDEYTFFSFSEGEKSQINLSIIFAWRAIAKMRNSASTNLLILDEIADSAANANAIEAFMKILDSQSGQNIFVISHKQEYQEHFHHSMEFKKIKNFSRIV